MAGQMNAVRINHERINMNREAPFGYEWKDGELVINEKNVSIVK
ncbi:MAG: hypothetical protein E6600_04090 [Anaerocolumna aminovalerica]|nr:hypothetical protein [Anaerocolumna aminovalerica]MDU6263668.1 hypothetical protein [Anaerocolumna aminovalerica]